MLNRPNLGQLVATAEAEINALVPGADARLRFSVLGVFARVWARLVDGLYSALSFLSRQLFVMTATRQYLALIAESYGTYRLPKQVASGCIDVFGTAGSSVLSGTVFQRADGVQFEATSGVILDADGYGQVPAICLTQGVAGNSAQGVAMQPATAIAGVTSAAVCAAAISGGADEESDDALRARVLQRLQNSPGAGTVKDWERWAFSMSAAVTRVWVIPTVYGNSTVGIVFTMDNSSVVPPPSSIAQMTAHLNQFVPVGSTVYVFAPTLKPINFSISETPNGDPAVRTAITNELRDLLYREGGPGNTIPISHITEAISNAFGETDHSLIAPSTPIVLSGGAPVFEVGVLGTVNWV
jgi:uncharacterized phage protein gp47/JayE